MLDPAGSGAGPAGHGPDSPRRVLPAVIAALLGALVASPLAAELPLPCGAGCGPGIWVSGGAATRTLEGRTLAIQQQSARAILNWQSFNVAPGHRVEFRQPSETAVALNRIYQGDPSRIQGELQANGQVYLINQNGILFGQGSRVNVNGLVASSLDVDDAIFNGVGIVGAINQESPRAAFRGAGSGGAVEVEPGARITTGRGGRVLLMAPTVRNGGRIETPEGQTLLAAATDEVYLAASEDPDLRGLLVEVRTGGTASNLGEILAERGNVSLVGLAVNQSGLVRATTTTNLGGSVRLAARDQVQVQLGVGGRGNLPVATRGGELVLGPGSRTEVLPERQAGVTAVDAQPQPLSRVTLTGSSVRLAEAASVTATGGRVEVTASQTPNNPVAPGIPKNASRIVLEPGSRIDVAGDDSTVLPMARNLVELELRGNELRDAPAQRDGPLRNQRVAVDVRRGTPLADISGAVAGIGREVGERLAAGGSISLRSEGDLHLMAGSVLDVSGGSLRYLDGVLPTTLLVTADGRLVDIANADPLLAYAGVFGSLERTFEKWGQRDTWTPGAGAGAWQAGYTEGRDAGSIELLARNLELAGELLGHARRGELQRQPAGSAQTGTARPYEQVPLAGLLRIGDVAQAGAAQADFRTPAAWLQGRAGPAFGAQDSLPEDLPLYLDPERVAAGGIGRLAVYSNGRILLPEAGELTLPPGGELTLVGGELELAGAVRVLGGSVFLEARKTGLVDPGASGVTLSPGASVDVSGLWVDERVAGSGARPLFTDGGNVTVRASGPLTLAAGSRIDASGGARLSAAGSLSAGRGGTLDLRVAFEELRSLRLDGELSAYGFREGGELTLQGAGFLVSGDTTGAPSGLVGLDPGFFTRGGFQSFDLRATHGGVRVAEGAQVPLRAAHLYFGEVGEVAAVLPANGERPVLGIGTLPDWLRAPVHLSAAFVPENSAEVLDVPLELGAGSLLAGDPGARISLSAETGLLIDGVIRAHGGAITLKLPRATRRDPGFRPELQIRLGEGSLLDVGGTAVFEPADPTGLVGGALFGGGTVQIQADRGYLVGEPGARIDVSGFAAPVGLPVRGAPGDPPARELVHASAGTVTLQAAEGIAYAGSLAGRAAAAPGASAGSLSLRLMTSARESGEFVPGLVPFPGGPREIRVGSMPVPEVPRAVPVAAELNGLGFLRPEQVVEGGFEVLELRADPVGLGAPVAGTSGRIRFQGEVALRLGERLILDTPVLAGDGGFVHLQAPYVALGHQSATNFVFAPAASGGTASLQVGADHLELVGTTTLEGFGGDGLVAAALRSEGDLVLRGLRVPASAPTFQGALRAAGDLVLQADRVYPSTRSEFTLSAPGAEVRFASADAVSIPPHSVAGSLRVDAARIVQGGALLAPFGRLDLQATERLELEPASLTSTSGAGLLTLYGQIQFGTDWVYPLPGQTRVLASVPDRTVQLTAPEIRAATGAVLDVAGGGDLLAYEFLPGPGGSRDLLTAANTEGAFAVLPGLGSLYAPFEPVESAGFTVAPGTTVHLSGGGGLPAGEYARLPARYALLPGAFLVTPLDGVTDLAPGTSFVRADSTPVVAGRAGSAGSDRQESRWSGFLVEDGTRVRARAEYREALASAHFTALGAEARTVDAGRVAVAATGALSLAARLAPTPAPGRGAQVDITADRIAVVEALTGDADRVELLATDLNGLGAASLLLGGTRTGGADAVAVASGAERLSIEAGVSLAAPEILLAATDLLSIAGDTALVGAGTGAPEPRPVHLSGDGAFVRVAANGPLELSREKAPGVAGRLEVAAGAILEAGGAITLEASRDTVFRGRLRTAGGAVSLSSSRISLGDVPEGTPGLVLSAAQLAELEAGELVLTSAGAIDLHGAVTLAGTALERLVLDAAALRGFAAGGSLLAADTVVLRNQRGVAPGAPEGAPEGSLELRAQRELELGAGSYAVQGFEGLDLVAGDWLRGSGAAQLAMAGDLEVTAPWLVGASGARVALAAGGAVTVHAAAGAAPPPLAPGAAFTLEGSEVAFGGRARLPSGQIALTAVGAVRVLDGALLDVAGIPVAFDQVVAGSPGGRVSLTSLSDSVSLGSAPESGTPAGVDIHVSGATVGGAGGRLEISAAAGTLLSTADVRVQGAALPAEPGGRLSLDVDSLGAEELARFAGWNQAGGFRGETRLRQRSGDLFFDGALTARELSLTTDTGSLTLAGSLDATPAAVAADREGGRVVLNAGGDLSVLGSARIQARGAAADAGGGTVLLETRGSLALAATDDAGAASIDVSPGEGGTPGYVRLVAPRVNNLTALAAGNSDLRILDAAATIAGAGRIDAVGDRSYNASTITAATLNNPRNHATAFTAAAGTIAARLGRADDPAFHVVPGITLRSNGNLTLASGWDLEDGTWNGAGAVGLITLRAGGNLNLNASLSDGIIQESDPFGFGVVRDAVGTGPSWSFRLVAGADAGSADALAVLAGAGDVRVADQQRVRTGSGAIQVAAGRDVILNGARAAIYTAGESRGGLPPELDPTGIGSFLLFADFLHRGGDLEIRAGRDLLATTTSTQLVNQWLARIGGVFPDPFGSGDELLLPTAWAVAVGEFAQHLGALGGGNVTLSAGRHVERVSVSLPTTAQPGGSLHAPVLALAGGGRLRVESGEDLRGGLFYLGAGTADITVGGALTGSAGGAPPSLAMGDGQWRVTAGGDLSIGTVLNPTVLPQGLNQGLAQKSGLELTLPSYFFTYSPESAVHLTSVAGDVRLVNDPRPFSTGPTGANPTLEADVHAGFAATTYPGTLTARSLAGDIVLEGGLRLFPAPRGQLELLAARDLTTTGDPVTVLLSDTDPALLPGVAVPTVSFERAVAQLGPQARNPATVHAAIPVHSGDPEPVRLVAREGDIRPAGENSLSFVLAKAARVVAGNDVSNVNLRVQQVEGVDQTLVRAGRDLRFPTNRNSSGTFSPNTNRIEVSGPGRLDVSAGRHVDLGTSAGIVTSGNTFNPALPDGGADVLVLAGAGAGTDEASFTRKYLEDNGAYAADLTNYLDSLGVTPEPGQSAVDAFAALPADRRLPFLLETVLFGELLASGTAAAESGSGDFDRGFEAIATLFPAERYEGDLSLLLSRIGTLDGGDISFVVPGGRVNAGVTATTGLAKGAAELGVVAQRAGDIRAFVHGDFEVNESRVFTLDGGDILIWSSTGDIDAGRGAKTAIAVPPPTIRFDASGNAIIEFPPAVAGSGIRAAVTTPGREPGGVALFAPAGVVRAGDAGIDSAGNLTIGAVEVIGSDNIRAGGDAVGVPVADTGSLAAGLTGISNVAASASKATESQATGVAERQSQAAGQGAREVLALITVEVLGFGD